MFKVDSSAGAGPILFDIRPVNYTFNVRAMSSDKLPVIVPGFFTIGPHNNEHGLLKYARFVSARHMPCDHVRELVMDVIESEIRVGAASMTLEEMLSDTKKFKQQVFVEVQLELDQFGLQVYNANVKQLLEVPWYGARLRWRQKITRLFSRFCLKSKSD